MTDLQFRELKLMIKESVLLILLTITMVGCLIIGVLHSNIFWSIIYTIGFLITGYYFRQTLNDLMSKY